MLSESLREAIYLNLDNLKYNKTNTVNIITTCVEENLQLFTGDLTLTTIVIEISDFKGMPGFFKIRLKTKNSQYYRYYHNKLDSNDYIIKTLECNIKMFLATRPKKHNPLQEIY